MATNVYQRPRAHVTWDRNPTYDISYYHGGYAPVYSKATYKKMTVKIPLGCQEWWLEKWVRDFMNAVPISRDLNLRHLGNFDYEFFPTSVPEPGSVVAQGCFVTDMHQDWPSNVINATIAVASVNVIAKPCHLPKEITIDGYKYRLVE